MLEQNSEFNMTMTTTPAMIDHIFMLVPEPERKTFAALPTQQKPGQKTKTKRHLNHMDLGIPITHELPPSDLKMRKHSAI